MAVESVVSQKRTCLTILLPVTVSSNSPRLGALYFADQLELVGDIAVDIFEVAPRTVRFAVHEERAEESTKVSVLIKGIDRRPPRLIISVLSSYGPAPQTRDESEAPSLLDHQCVRGRGDTLRFEVVHQVRP